MTMDRRAANETPAITHVDRHETVPIAIVSAVADVRDVAIDELDALFDRVDPDAVETIFSAGSDADGADPTMRFTSGDCSIVLYGDGRVVVSPIAGRR